MEKRVAWMALTAWLLPLQALASDYVCYTKFIPNNVAIGPEGGYLYFSIYDGPNCTGAYQYTKYLCSTGSYSPLCADSDYYKYSAAQLLSVFSALRSASVDGTHVTVQLATCEGGGPDCGAAINFFGN